MQSKIINDAALTSESNPATVTPNNYLAALAEVASPYIIGVLDGECNRLCLPELYFSQRGQQLEYCEGWEAIRGPSLLSLQMRGKAAKYPIVLTDEEIAAETEALVDGKLDEDFWRHGQW